jgi:hypothetical protein
VQNLLHFMYYSHPLIYSYHPLTQPPKVMDWLVRCAGVDPTVRTTNGLTALHLAAQVEWSEVERSGMERGGVEQRGVGGVKRVEQCRLTMQYREPTPTRLCFHFFTILLLLLLLLLLILLWPRILLTIEQRACIHAHVTGQLCRCNAIPSTPPRLPCRCSERGRVAATALRG